MIQGCPTGLLCMIQRNPHLQSRSTSHPPAVWYRAILNIFGLPCIKQGLPVTIIVIITIHLTVRWITNTVLLHLSTCKVRQQAIQFMYKIYVHTIYGTVVIFRTLHMNSCKTVPSSHMAVMWIVSGVCPVSNRVWIKHAHCKRGLRCNIHDNNHLQLSSLTGELTTISYTCQILWSVSKPYNSDAWSTDLFQTEPESYQRIQFACMLQTLQAKIALYHTEKYSLTIHSIHRWIEQDVLHAFTFRVGEQVIQP